MKTTYKTSEDGKCRFYEKKHKYKLGRRELISVTTLFKEYFEEFDASKIANLKVMINKSRCNRAGIPYDETCKVSYWKKQWKASAEHGTRVHRLIESWVNNAPTDVEGLKTMFEERDLLKYNRAKHWLYQFLEDKRNDKIFSEYILYDSHLGIAGQIDLLIKKGSEIHIVDYKTNDKLSTVGYKGKKAAFPIQDMDDCSMSKYRLQLSLYAYMLEKKGYKVGSLTLLHLTEKEAIPYNIEYMKDVVQKIVEHRISSGVSV